MSGKRQLAIGLGAVVFADTSCDPIEPVRKLGKPNSMLHRSDRGSIWRIETLSVQNASISQVTDLLKPLETQGWKKLRWSAAFA